MRDGDVCREDQWFRLCYTHSTGPGSPRLLAQVESNRCVPFARAHGSQEMHTSHTSHFQTRPWLSGETKGPSFVPLPLQAWREPLPSAWHRQALPLLVDFIKTTSLLWGCRVLHPSCTPAMYPGWQLIWEPRAG